MFAATLLVPLAFAVAAMMDRSALRHRSSDNGRFRPCADADNNAGFAASCRCATGSCWSHWCGPCCRHRNAAAAVAVAGLSITDAYFEAMSGLTASGGTALSGLDQLPLSVNIGAT